MSVVVAQHTTGAINVMNGGRMTPLALPPAATARARSPLFVVLLLLSWAALVAATVLARFGAPSVKALLGAYGWRTTIVDALGAALVAALGATVTGCVRAPLAACVLSLPLAVALVVKRAMLAADPSDHDAVLRGWSVACACACAWLAAFASLEGARAQRLRRLGGLHLQGSTKLLSDEEAAAAAEAPSSTDAAPKRGATVGRLISLARPEVPIISLATVALFLSSASQMAMPYLVGKLIGAVAKSGDEAELSQIALMLLGIFTAGGFFSFLRGSLFTLAGERVVARLRKMLYDHLVVQDVGFFDANKTGELMNRLASDTTVIQTATTVNVSMGLRFAAQVVIGLVLIFWYSVKLSGVMLAVVPLVAFAAVAYGKWVKSLSQRYQKALATASETAQEVFSSVRTVRSFAAEGKEAARYGKSVDDAYAMGAKKALAYGLFGGLIGTLGQYAVCLVLWYGGTLTLRGEMEAADLTSFLLYTIMIAFALGGLSDLFGSLMNALGASRRVFDLLDTTPTIPCAGGAVPASLRGEVRLEEVSFHYPSRPDVTVLSGVTLHIRPGTVTALCGPSGSGKSSVIALIERFYDPTAGALTVDGEKLTALDPAWWRKQVALVAQEPVLFAASVKENIAYGVAAATDDAVRAAATTANAHAFISAFPEGYDTLVGERGVQLSGGQKQRIAIARAILADPKLLLLDEATSALDAESEHVVQEAIDRLMKNRTTVVVAHRLSTIRSADVICVVEKGKLVERGTHDELYAQEGLYHQLVKRQLESPGA